MHTSEPLSKLQATKIYESIRSQGKIMSTLPIADLHCDLLAYLGHNSQRTPYDFQVRCSVPQLRSGAVKYQTMAVFAETGTDSVKKGMQQVSLYKHLAFKYPQDFLPLELFAHDSAHLDLRASPSHDKIVTLMAFEGASTFCDEDEPLICGLQRLNFVIENVAKPLYISLTWNMENRFGGGAHTKVGLKDDGRKLLDFLHNKRIAIDLSHTSDQLAHDIIVHINKQGLHIPMMASHSNSRSVTSVPRNLPDDIAKEILSRKGIIGMVFYQPFIGAEENCFVKHLEHWFKMGGSKQVCFGADFFHEKDFPKIVAGQKQIYFSQFSDASCYGKVLEFLQKKLNLTSKDLENLAYKNFLTFLKNHIL